MRPLIAHCYRSFGKVYDRIGKLKEADESFATATAMYREMDMTFWLERGQSR
jgi:hypothetical protein